MTRLRSTLRRGLNDVTCREAVDFARTEGIEWLETMYECTGSLYGALT